MTSIAKMDPGTLMSFATELRNLGHELDSSAETLAALSTESIPAEIRKDIQTYRECAQGTRIPLRSVETYLAELAEHRAAELDKT